MDNCSVILMTLFFFISCITCPSANHYRAFSFYMNLMTYIEYILLYKKENEKTKHL